MTTLLTTGAVGVEDAAVGPANSGGYNGNPFDSVSVGGTGTFTFDNTHGFPQSFRVAGDAANNILATWSTSMGTVSEAWGLAYFYLTAAPAANDTFLWLRNGSSQVARARFTTAGKLELVNAAGTVIDTSATSVVTGGWGALQWHCDALSSGGTFAASLINDPSTGAVTETVGGSGVALLNNITQCSYGRVANASPNTKWLANLGYSDDGPMDLLPATSRLLEVELQGAALSQARSRLLEVELIGAATSQARSRLLEVLLTGRRAPEDLEPADTWAASGGVWRPLHAYRADGGQWT
jgi:hypothetical protein